MIQDRAAYQRRNYNLYTIIWSLNDSLKKEESGGISHGTAQILRMRLKFWQDRKKQIGNELKESGYAKRSNNKR